ncbi:MAG: hypothetical protein PVF15_00735 [Candidatus Bathyarchaeota archaeon]|jgi:hypothetical protein
MGKLTIVKKEKIPSAEEHEKKLKEDPVSAKMLKERDRQVEKALKKIKEGQ